MTPNRASELTGGNTMSSERFKDTNELCLYLYSFWNFGRNPSDVASKEARELPAGSGTIQFRCYDTRPRDEVRESCLTRHEVPHSDFFYLQCDPQLEDVLIQPYTGHVFKRRSSGRAPNYGRCVPKPLRQPPSGPQTGIRGPSPAGQSSIGSANLKPGEVACVEKSAEGVDRRVNAWIQAIGVGSGASSTLRTTVPWLSITEVGTVTSVSAHDRDFLSMITDSSGKSKVYRACAHQASGRPNVMLKIGVVL